LHRLKGSGYTIVIAEHDVAPLADIIDRYLVMESGWLVGSTVEPPRHAVSPAARPAIPSAPRCEEASVVARGVRLAYPETGGGVKGVDFRVLRGERVHAGLDLPQRSELLGILGGLGSRWVTTVIIASPDELPDKGWPDRLFTMEGGLLDEAAR
jgi:energy-coupling factor transport system ATP-binding protein